MEEITEEDAVGYSTKENNKKSAGLFRECTSFSVDVGGFERMEEEKYMVNHGLLSEIAVELQLCVCVCVCRGWQERHSTAPCEAMELQRAWTAQRCCWPRTLQTIPGERVQRGKPQVSHAAELS